MTSRPSSFRPLTATLLAAALAFGLTACTPKPAEDAAAATPETAATPDAMGSEDTGLATELLDKLKTAESEEEAALIEEEIWGAWMFSGSPTVDLLMVRAQDAVEADDLDRARDMYDRAIEIKPDYAESWHRRAILFFNEGKYDEAIADLEHALRAEPRHFGAWIGLGAMFESIDRPDAALLAYRKALEVHPNAAAAKEGADRLTVAVEGRAL